MKVVSKGLREFEKWKIPSLEALILAFPSKEKECFASFHGRDKDFFRWSLFHDQG
jgi:hypothetical protein